MSLPTPQWIQDLDSLRINMRAGVTESEIDRADTVLNCRFPADYREFMLATDGCEMMYGDVPDVIISPLWSPLEDDLAVVKDSEPCQEVTWPVKIIRPNAPSEEHRGNSAEDSRVDNRSDDALESRVSLLHIGTDDARQNLVKTYYCFNEE